MPMDSVIWQETADQAFKRRCVGWKLTLSLLPRRCYYTGKCLWFKYAYMGVSMLTGPGEPILEYRWCERKEYLFLKIKDII